MALTDAMDLPRPLGPYTLLRRLAVGGMAEVYVAKAKGIGGFEKLVAIKVIHPRYSEDDHFIQMLVEEAKLSVLLTHANVAQTFDLGCIDDTYFIVMEFIEGADAYRILKRAADRHAALPLDLCAYMVAETCHGLDYAHRKRDTTGQPLNIVHRDVSPQNILISFAGEVKLVDFGIAKAALRTGNTEVGVIKGKYYYMSPEQAWADPVDSRSDIFSTGVLLYELLTGEMLYQEDNLPKLLDRVRKAEIAPPSSKRREIPAELDEITMRALAKEPSDRFQTGHDFAQALTQFLYGHHPTFTAARLSGLMSELFPEEMAAATGGAQPPMMDQVLQSVIPAERTSKSGLERMRPGDFQPDPQSAIFDLGEDFGEEATSNEIPRLRLNHLSSVSRSSLPVAASAQEPEDDYTFVSVDSREWDAHLVQLPSEPPSSPSVVSEWDDATLVDGSGEALRRMWAKSAATRPAPPAPVPAPRLEPSVPPPPLVPGITTEALPIAGGGIPDLSGWEDQSASEAYVGPDRFAPPPPSPVETGALEAMRGPTPQQHRRRLVFGAVAVVGVTLALALGALLSGEEVEPSRVEVVSVPAGAVVRLDGQTLSGTTPLVLSEGLTTGQTHQVEVELAGHEVWRTSFEAHEGLTRQIAVLAPLRVELQVQSVPPGAQIVVDGVAQGEAPVSLPGIALGRPVELRATLRGHRSVTRSVRAEAGGTTLVTLTLEPIPQAPRRR